MPLERFSEAEQIFRSSLNLYDGMIWSWLPYAIALAMQNKGAEATSALTNLRRVAPLFDIEGIAQLLERFWSHPTGDRAAKMRKQIDSLRDIWPS